MPDWLRRLHHSRRARNATFAGIAFIWLASCAGTLLANYTVAGMNTLPYKGGRMPQTAQAHWHQPDPEWLRDAKVEMTGGSDVGAGFSSTATGDYGNPDY